MKYVTIISIFLLSFCNCKSQTLRGSDSINFKKDLENLLKKYGLNNLGYKIDVQSKNQSGGQTAFMITNNYYNDPNYLPDSLNFEYSISYRKNKKILTLFPKKNSWNHFTLAFDTTINLIHYEPEGIIVEGGPATFTLKGKKYDMHYENISVPINKNRPVVVELDDKLFHFIIFLNKEGIKQNYIYHDGIVEWFSPILVY